MITEFKRLFKGRSEVYARAFPKNDKPGKVGYELIEEPLTDERLFDHLSGKALLGQYQLLQNNTVHWFAVDFDMSKDESELALDQKGTVLGTAMQQMETFEEAGLSCYLEVSRSGNGAHVWGFFEEGVPAAEVRAALKPLLIDADSYDRLYPVQTSVSTTKPYGNLIALPFFGALGKVANPKLGPGVLGGASVFLHRDTLEPVEPLEFMRSVFVNRREVIHELAAKAPKLAAVGSAYNGEAVAFGEVNPAGRPEKLGRGVLKLISDYGCQFMTHAFQNRQTLPEPQWYVALQQLSCFDNGREAAHLLSRGYAGYNPAETDAKYTHALQHPPVSCAYIQEHFPKNACKGCTCGAPYRKAQGTIEEVTKRAEEPLLRSDFKGSTARMQRRKQGAEPDGISWGMAGLDKYTRLRPKELTVIGAMPSIGKSLPLDAKILTPTGWTTMGALSVGSEVITVSGKATQVLGVYPQGIRPAYKVTFCDGSSTECDDEHLWLTTTREERQAKTRPDWSVKSLKQIRETLRRKDTTGPAHAIPLVQPVEFAPKAAPLLSPYLLGVLLGDGYLPDATLGFSNTDDSILATVRVELALLGDRLVNDSGPDYNIVGTRRGRHGSVTRDFLRVLKLVGTHAATKFVPEEYWYASVEDRLALLQGLCDTDGSACTVNTVEYSTISQQLRDAAVHLARSLGGQVSVSERIPKYRYKGEVRFGQLSYRVFIRLPYGMAPFRSVTKLAKYSSRCSNRITRRTIVSIDPVGEKQMQCIKVADPSSLYVTDDFIVTHNTAFVVDAVYSLASRGVPVFMFSAETGVEGFEDRLLARVSGVDSRAIRGERMRLGVPFPLTDDEEAAVLVAAETLRPLPIYINYTVTRPDTILNVLEDALLRNRIGFDEPYVVFMDYLQFAANGEDDYGALSKATMEFKALAKIIRQSVVLLSQLQRKTEGDDVPLINWFKGTGRIENDADVAMILTGDRIPGAVAKRKLSIVKQREGDAGVHISLKFYQTCCLFEEEEFAAIPTGIDLFAQEAGDAYD